MKIFCPALVAVCPLMWTSCVKVEPIEVKPIEINVNVRVKVDRELDDFFGDLDKKDTSLDR